MKEKWAKRAQGMKNKESGENSLELTKTYYLFSNQFKETRNILIVQFLVLLLGSTFIIPFFLTRCVITVQPSVPEIPGTRFVI